MRSGLAITDLRVAVVADAPMTCPIIRIDTNRGIHGLGEVRDGASPTYALMLKSRLLGKDPRNVERICRDLRQFGGHGRLAGGVCAVEMALWDIVGKFWGVPVWQLLGGKYRERVRVYCDTDMAPDPGHTAQRLLARMQQGFTYLKMDLGIGALDTVAGGLGRPTGMRLSEAWQTQHMFTGLELTDRGLGFLVDYVRAVREGIGYEVPLAIDHVGHIGVNSCIRLGRALEPYNIAWLEDLIPWQYTALWKRITESVAVPTCTGEDVYLASGFEPLCRANAVDVIHPDLATAGGIAETKRIGDLARDCGIPMAMHFAGTPISCMANVHCAAATEGFLALENHSVDVPWWSDLVTGVEGPIVRDGFIDVPDAPGLGIDLDLDVLREHVPSGGVFEPTPEWDGEQSWDRLWS